MRKYGIFKKINKKNQLANTYFQKKCNLPNKSKLQIVQLHIIQKYMNNAMPSGAALLISAL